MIQTYGVYWQPRVVSSIERKEPTECQPASGPEGGKANVLIAGGYETQPEERIEFRGSNRHGEGGVNEGQSRSCFHRRGSRAPTRSLVILLSPDKES